MDTLSTQDFGVFLDMNQWDFQGPPLKIWVHSIGHLPFIGGPMSLGDPLTNQAFHQSRLTVQAVDAEDGAAAAAGVRP